MKGDWVSEVKMLLSDLKIDLSFEQIKSLKKKYFRKIVRENINKIAFTYLITKVKSKGKGIDYKNTLSMQHYLMPNSVLDIYDQIEIFSYRTRMNDLKYNFPGNKEEEVCQCGSQMTNIYLYTCIILNEGRIHIHTYAP